MNAQELATQLRRDWNQYIDSQWSARNAASNNASALGHECLAYLTFNRTHGRQRLKPGIETLRKFERGRKDEEWLKVELGRRGYTVVESQRPFEWEKFQIRGYIDGKIIVDGHAFIYECKSISPYLWKKAEQEHASGRVENEWLRKYVTQLMLYEAMASSRDWEVGLMIYYDPVANDILPVAVELDEEWVDRTLRKAEAVNKIIESGKTPSPVNIDGEAIDWENCIDCGYFHICQPPTTDHGGDLSDQDAMRLEHLIDRRMALERDIKSVEDEIKHLKEEEKKLVGQREMVMLQKYVIKGSWVNEKRVSYLRERYYQYRIITK